MRREFLAALLVALGFVAAPCRAENPPPAILPPASEPTPALPAPAPPPGDPQGNKEQPSEPTPALSAPAPASDGDCPPAPACCPAPGCPPRFWVDADYLLWWVKKAPAVPLVTTGPEALYSGALDQPGVRVLFGQDRFEYGASSGLRFSAGSWIDDKQTWGVEVGGLFLEKRSVGFSAQGDANGQPYLARPFINALTGNENVYFTSQNFADPTLSAGMTGGITAASTTRLWGWETNALYNVARANGFTLNLLGGFRSLSLLEGLRVSEQFSNIVAGAGGGTSYLGMTIDPPGSVGDSDSFVCSNNFYGPQVGAKLKYQMGRLSMDLSGQLAMGVTQEVVHINGVTTLYNAGAPVGSTPGGVLALPSNIGNHFQNDFAVVPQVGLNLDYAVTNWLNVQVGYTFLYWSSVARPGAQVDRSINPNNVPSDFGYTGTDPLARPGFAFQTTSYWAQGINFGLLCRF